MENLRERNLALFAQDFLRAESEAEQWKLLREYHEWTEREWELTCAEAEHNGFSPYMYLPLPLYELLQHPFMSLTINERRGKDAY